MADMHQLAGDVSKAIAAKLAQLQGERTDEEMGALLGVTRTHWSHIRSGRRLASYSTVKRAAIHWPELSLIVIRDWTSAPEEAAS